MAGHLYRTCAAEGWFPDASFGVVLVRERLGHYVSYPPMDEVEGIDELLDAIKVLNCGVALVVTSDVVRELVDNMFVPSSLRFEHAVVADIEGGTYQSYLLTVL